jgi:hypothetical protein
LECSCAAFFILLFLLWKNPRDFPESICLPIQETNLGDARHQLSRSHSPPQGITLVSLILPSPKLPEFPALMEGIKIWATSEDTTKPVFLVKEDTYFSLRLMCDSRRGK